VRKDLTCPASSLPTVCSEGAFCLFVDSSSLGPHWGSTQISPTCGRTLSQRFWINDRYLVSPTSDHIHYRPHNVVMFRRQRADFFSAAASSLHKTGVSSFADLKPQSVSSASPADKRRSSGNHRVQRLEETLHYFSVDWLCSIACRQPLKSRSRALFW